MVADEMVSLTEVLARKYNCTSLLNILIYGVISNVREITSVFLLWGYVYTNMNFFRFRIQSSNSKHVDRYHSSSSGPLRKLGYTCIQICFQPFFARDYCILLVL